MTVLAFIGTLLALTSCGLFTSIWLHDQKFYVFKKVYIEWVHAHWGAIFIIYIGGMAMMLKDIAYP